MKDSITFKLLLIVRGNGNITSLIKDGYKYVQIAGFVNDLVVEGYVVMDNDKMVLSQKGNLRILELNKKYGRKNSSQWISPEEKSKIPKLKEKDVYLPNQNELFF